MKGAHDKRRQSFRGTYAHITPPEIDGVRDFSFDDISMFWWHKGQHTANALLAILRRHRFDHLSSSTCSARTRKYCRVKAILGALNHPRFFTYTFARTITNSRTHTINIHCQSASLTHNRLRYVYIYTYIQDLVKLEPWYGIKLQLTLPNIIKCATNANAGFDVQHTFPHTYKTFTISNTKHMQVSSDVLIGIHLITSMHLLLLDELNMGFSVIPFI